MKDLEKIERLALNTVSKYYSSDARKYHTIHHITNMFELYHKFRDKFLAEFPDLNEEELIEAIAWHDSVYIIGNDANEELSAYLYSLKALVKNSIVYDAILSTKVGNKEFKNPVEKVLHDLDWSGFSDFLILRKNEEKIFFEATYDTEFTYKPDVVRTNQYYFYRSIMNKDLYVTETFKIANESARKNLKIRIEQMEKEK